MNWLALLVGLGIIVGAFLLKEGIAGLFAWLERKGWKIEEELAETLKIGIQGAWDNFVRDVKKKADDGKLTKEEKKEARDYAIKLAKEVAKGPVKKILLAMVPRALEALVSLLVQRRKKTVSE